LNLGSSNVGSSQNIAHLLCYHFELRLVLFKQDFLLSNLIEFIDASKMKEGWVSEKGIRIAMLQRRPAFQKLRKSRMNE
jgi:hypothetical protein